MLTCTFTDSTKITWHMSDGNLLDCLSRWIIGPETYTFDRADKTIDLLRSVKADGEELTMIEKMPNIPLPRLSVVCAEWYGDMAKFIVRNF